MLYQKHNEILQHHGFLPLKYLEFIFYKQNNLEEESEACLNFLKTNANLGDKSALSLLSDANNFAFYINVEKRNFDKALFHLGNATSLDLLTKQKFILLLKALQVKQEEIERLQEKQEETPVQPAIADTTKEERDIVSIGLMGPKKLNDFIANLDPKAIHAFFQKEKQALVAKSVDTTIKEQRSVWHIGKNTYSSDQQDVYPIEGKPNFYATIDRKIASKLDHQLLEKFQPVLSKWSTGKNNGGKFILPGGIELKIPSDDYRLHTERVYENPKRKFLIVFDHLGNHKETKKAAMTKYLKLFT